MNEGGWRTEEAFFKSWKEIVNREKEASYNWQSKDVDLLLEQDPEYNWKLLFLDKDFFTPSSETEGNEVRMDSYVN